MTETRYSVDLVDLRTAARNAKCGWICLAVGIERQMVPREMVLRVLRVLAATGARVLVVGVVDVVEVVPRDSAWRGPSTCTDLGGGEMEVRRAVLRFEWAGGRLDTYLRTVDEAEAARGLVRKAEVCHVAGSVQR